MTIDQLLQVIRAQPFKPFRLNLADGRHLEIHHPEFVARSPSGRTAIVYKPDESFEIVDLLLVVSIDPEWQSRLPPPQIAGASGLYGNNSSATIPLL